MPDHSTPAQLGFRMPAEWEPHRGTWLSWPHKEASWPGKFGPVPGIFAAMVRLLADHEEVHINVAGPAHGGRRPPPARRRRRGLGQRLLPPQSRPTTPGAATTGPSSCSGSPAGTTEEAILDWGYNAWGGKYPPYDLDDVIPTRIGRELRHPGVPPRHGAGGRLDRRERARHPAHDRGLPAQPEPQSPARPRGRSRRSLRELPRRRATSSGWATGSRATTPTATWTTSPASWTRRRSSPWSRTIRRTKTTSRSRRTWSGSATMRDQDGTPLRVVTLPMPRPLHHEGQRLPASYANFYIANGLVLLPTYDPERDAEAQATLQRLFPGPRRRRHRLHRPGLGPGRLPLRHPAVAEHVTA